MFLIAKFFSVFQIDKIIFIIYYESTIFFSILNIRCVVY